MSTHRVWKLGTDIDTDALAPGAYMKLGIEGIAPHCLERVRPEFAANVRPGDVIVAGLNFGIGSSREQAVAALVLLGIKAVIAPSFGGLFFRNAFNLGLLLLTTPSVDLIKDGEHIDIDLSSPSLITTSSQTIACEPIPPFLLDMVAAGGLFNQLRQQLRGPSADTPG
jgi:3-isopropylmalate/(R)-2-methylmalate dehydratase small subunit